MRERPARRRGVADSESGSSASAATSSDSDADNEPPTKKKTVVSVCPLCSHLLLLVIILFVLLRSLNALKVICNGFSQN